MFTDREEDIIIEEIREVHADLLLQHLVDKQGNRNGINQGRAEGSDAQEIPEGQYRESV
jgi:hypothetical protein